MVLQDVPQVLSSVADLDKAKLLGDARLHEDVDDAVERTEKREKRRRRLSARLVVYLVLALSLCRSLSIPNVLVTLIDGL